MTRRRKILAVCVGVVALLLLLLYHFKQRDTYKCASCHSKQHVYQWRLGMWPWSVPLSPRWERVDETQLRQHLFPPDHEHEWIYFQGSPYYFFGTTWGGCAIGSFRDTNDFCQWYELDSDFRGLIQTRIESGQLSKKVLQRIAGLPPWRHTEKSWRHTEKSPDAEVSDLTELAQSLLRQSGH